VRQRKHPIHGKPQRGLPKGAPFGWLHSGKVKNTDPGDTTIRYIENDYFPEDYFGTDFR
jgi:hypothetical protein